MEPVGAVSCVEVTWKRFEVRLDVTVVVAIHGPSDACYQPTINHYLFTTYSKHFGKKFAKTKGPKIRALQTIGEKLQIQRKRHKTEIQKTSFEFETFLK